MTCLGSILLAAQNVLMRSVASQIAISSDGVEKLMLLPLSSRRLSISSQRLEA